MELTEITTISALNPAMTLYDIQEIRKRWVEQNGQFAQRLAAMIKLLGSKVRTFGEEMLRFEADGIVCYLRSGYGQYDSKKEIYDKVDIVYVYLNGDNLSSCAQDREGATCVVCVKLSSLDDYPGTYHKDDLFVPGQWCATLLPHIEYAEKIREDKYNEQLNREKSDLLKLLCFGKDI